MWESIVVLHYPTLVGRSRLYVGKYCSYALSYFGGKEQTVSGKGQYCSYALSYFGGKEQTVCGKVL